MSKKKNKKKFIIGKVGMHGMAIPIPTDMLISASDGTSGIRVLKEKMNQVEVQIAKLQAGNSKIQKVEVIPPAIAGAVITIATNAWRAKVKMVNEDTGDAKDEMTKVYRHVASIIEALQGMGVEIVDPVGKTYDSGMALRVINFEEMPGINREQVKETIKPSILWNKQIVQIGEVIVGTPSLNNKSQEGEI